MQRKKGGEAIKEIWTKVGCLLIVAVLMISCSGQVEREGTEAQLEITPGGVETLSGGNGVTSSDGKIVPSSPSGASEQGLEEKGGLPGQSSANEGPQKWLIYTDTAYGFSVKYPDTYVILPEPTPLPATTPPVVHRVRFQDQQRASGQFVDREPAQFAIEVFELAPPAPLREWLHSARLIPARATVEHVHLVAAGHGLRVRLAVMIAPNEFYFFATKKYVYRLTPLGPYSKYMIDSFQIIS